MKKVVQPTPTQIQVAIRRGALWLTKQKRNWHNIIDIEQINLAESSRTPAALALGRNSSWDEEMTLSRAVWLGLLFPGATPQTIELANKCWKAEARARKTPESSTTRPYRRVSAA